MSWKHFYQKIRDGLFQDLIFSGWWCSGADQKDRRQRDNFDAISYPESSGRVFVSGADQKNQKIDFDTIFIPNMQRNNFVKFEDRQLSVIVISILIITITKLSNLIGYQLPWFQP